MKSCLALLSLALCPLASSMEPKLFRSMTLSDRAIYQLIGHDLNTELDPESSLAAQVAFEQGVAHFRDDNGSASLTKCFDALLEAGMIDKPVLRKLLEGTFSIGEASLSAVEALAANHKVDLGELLESSKTKTFPTAFYDLVFSLHLKGGYFNTQILDALVYGGYPEELLNAVVKHVSITPMDFAQLIQMPLPAPALETLFDSLGELGHLGSSILPMALEKRIPQSLMGKIIQKMRQEGMAYIIEHNLRSQLISAGYNL